MSRHLQRVRQSQVTLAKAHLTLETTDVEGEEIKFAVGCWLLAIRSESHKQNGVIYNFLVSK